MSDARDVVDQFRRAVDVAGLTVNEITAMLVRAAPAVVAGMNAAHQHYLAAGAPYGDTEAGMVRWYRETYR